MFDQTLQGKVIKSIAQNPAQHISADQLHFIENSIIPHLLDEEIIWLSIHATNINIKQLALNRHPSGNVPAINAKRANVLNIEFARTFWEMFPYLHAQHGSLANFLKTQ